MKKPIIIFDLDGTLVDTSTDIANSVIEVIKNSFPKDFSENLNYHSIEEMIGRGAGPLIRSALELLSIDFDEEVLEKTIKAFREHYSTHLADTSKAFPGIESLLEKLKKKNIATAVATNKPGYLARILLPQVLEHKFELVIGPDDTGIAKPDPKMIRDIEKNTESSALVLIGDTIVDQMTAENAKIHFIGVNWGLTNFDRSKTSLNCVDTATEMEELIYKLLSENS